MQTLDDLITDRFLLIAIVVLLTIHILMLVLREVLYTWRGDCREQEAGARGQPDDQDQQPHEEIEASDDEEMLRSPIEETCGAEDNGAAENDEI